MIRTICIQSSLSSFGQTFLSFLNQKEYEKVSSSLPTLLNTQLIARNAFIFIWTQERESKKWDLLSYCFPLLP